MKQERMKLVVATLVLGLAPLAVPVPSAAATQVSVNVNIGTPPPVVVRERPTMVYLSEPAAYVAVGIPFDIFFVSGRYYYFHDNNWFFGHAYNGPWVVVAYRSLPPGLQKYKVERLHEFRDREYRVFKAQGPAFKGKHFDADEDHDSQGKSHGNNGRGNGRGK